MKNTSIQVPRKFLTGVIVSFAMLCGGGNYSGQFTWPVNPQNVTVLSNLGGSTSSAVAAK